MSLVTCSRFWAQETGVFKTDGSVITSAEDVLAVPVMCCLGILASPHTGNFYALPLGQPPFFCHGLSWNSASSSVC